ncbi:MAG: hypothetical protein Q9188_001461 [Gyalolechia gomerana]
MVYRHHVAHGSPHEPTQRMFLERISAGERSIDLLVAGLDALSYSMRCRKATDLRDHVYALYGIINRFVKQLEIQGLLVPPSYHKSRVEEAYTDYYRAILQNSKTLLLLSNVEDRPDDSSSSLPSWVPISAKTGQLVSRAPVRSRPQSPGTHGRQNPLHEICQGPPGPPFQIPPQPGSGISALAYHFGDQAQDQRPARAHLADAFREHLLMFCSMTTLDAAKSLDAGKDEPTRFEPLAQLAASTPEAARVIPSLSDVVERKNIHAEIRRFRSLERSEKGISASQLHDANAILQKKLTVEARALPFSRQSGTVFNTKRLVTTKRGFVGTAPLSGRMGDEVVLLPGGKVPFTLRAKRGGRVGKLVGESYIHGIMPGEALKHDGMRRTQVNLE